MNFRFLLILVSLFTYVLVITAPFKTKPYGDFDFHVQTKSVVEALCGAKTWDSVHITKAPGAVLFYLIPYSIVGPDHNDNDYWYAGIIWTGLLMTAAILLLYEAGRNLFGEIAGRITEISVFVIPLHVYYSLGILAEGMAFISVILFAYGWSLWRVHFSVPFYRSVGWYFTCLAIFTFSVVAVLAIMAGSMTVRRFSERQDSSIQFDYLLQVTQHGRF